MLDNINMRMPLHKRQGWVPNPLPPSESTQGILVRIVHHRHSLLLVIRSLIVIRHIDQLATASLMSQFHIKR